MNNWKNLPKWVWGHLFYKADMSTENPKLENASPQDANLVSSRVGKVEGVSYHRPLLDLDVSSFYVASSTPGHAHLYINKVISEEKYEKILYALNEAGIIQDGIIEHQWKKEGHTALRLPGVNKEVKSLSSGVASNDTKSTAMLVSDKVQLIEKPHPLKVAVEKVVGGTIGNQGVVETGQDPTLSLLDRFERLAEIASKTGQPFSSIIKEWYKFSEYNSVNKEAPKQNVVHTPGASPWIKPDEIF